MDRPVLRPSPVEFLPMTGSLSLRRSPLSGAATLLVASLALAGCNTTGDAPDASVPAAAPSSGGMFGNLFKSSTPAPRVEMQIVDDFQCPEIEILEGAAAIRQTGGDAIRSQVSISNTARECTVNGNQVTIKVGVEGRALLGTGGSPGTYSAPVRVVVKDGEKVLASRLQRKAVTIPSGDTQAAFVVIEDGIVVPKDADLSILVGLDASGRADRPAKKRRGG